MHRFAERYADELGAAVTFTWTTEREAALKDADFVIITAQVGGHTQVEGIRAWCESQGYYRGFKLWTIIQSRLMLSGGGRWAPVEAQLIQAEPGVRAAVMTRRASGVRPLPRLAANTPSRHRHRSRQGEGHDVGFNHEIWLTRFEYDGVDAYPLLDEWIETKSAESRSRPGTTRCRPPLSSCTADRHMPIGDTPRSGWWLHQNLETKRRWYGSLSAASTRTRLAAVPGRRMGAWRVHAAANDAHEADGRYPRPLASSTSRSSGAVERQRGHAQVNVPNHGAIENSPDDVVVGTYAVCSHRGISLARREAAGGADARNSRG
jgi:alpha-galactosidase